jgi:Subtilase family
MSDTLLYRELFPSYHPSWGDHGAGRRNIYKVPSACAHAKQFQGHPVAYGPPDKLILSATHGELAALPEACSTAAVLLRQAARLHPALPQVAVVSANAMHLRTCDSAAAIGHSCPAQYTSGAASAPLVSLEVHFTPVPDTRPECRQAAPATASTARNSNAASTARNSNAKACATPQHHAFAAAAAHDWAAPLRARLRSRRARLEARSGLLLVHVEPAHVLAAADAIAAQPLVATVAPAKVHRSHNLAAAGAIVQSAGGDAAGAAESHPFWEVGITGTGQVIGIGDSGLDMDHCAYRDARVPFAGFGTGMSHVPQFTSDAHRKVALYYMCDPACACCATSHRELRVCWHTKVKYMLPATATVVFYALSLKRSAKVRDRAQPHRNAPRSRRYADGSDVASGHGSHVAGIAAAAPLDSGDGSQRGVAHDARLAFFDLGDTSSGRGATISAPYDLANTYALQLPARGCALVCVAANW